MRFSTCDGEELHLRFIHGELINQRFTECVVYIGTTMVGDGYAIVHPRDNFCRKTGRKISLGKALLDSFPGRELKPARRHIWTEYLKKFPPSRNNK